VKVIWNLLKLFPLSLPLMKRMYTTPFYNFINVQIYNIRFEDRYMTLKGLLDLIIEKDLDTITVYRVRSPDLFNKAGQLVYGRKRYVAILQDGHALCTCLKVVHSGIPCEHIFVVLLRYPKYGFHIKFVNPKWIIPHLRHKMNYQDWIFLRPPGDDSSRQNERNQTSNLTEPAPYSSPSKPSNPLPSLAADPNRKTSEFGSPSKLVQRPHLLPFGKSHPPQSNVAANEVSSSYPSTPQKPKHIDVSTSSREHLTGPGYGDTAFSSRAPIPVTPTSGPPIPMSPSRPIQPSPLRHATAFAGTLSPTLSDSFRIANESLKAAQDNSLFPQNPHDRFKMPKRRLSRVDSTRQYNFARRLADDLYSSCQDSVERLQLISTWKRDLAFQEKRKLLQYQLPVAAEKSGSAITIATDNTGLSSGAPDETIVTPPLPLDPIPNSSKGGRKRVSRLRSGWEYRRTPKKAKR